MKKLTIFVTFLILLIFTEVVFHGLHKRQAAKPTPVIKTQASRPTPAPVTKIYGVNISGGEFGPENLPGAMYADYLYPQSTDEYQYYSGKHISVIRLPIRWERVQHEAFGELNEPDINQIRNVLSTASQYNMKVILDLHNFGRYYGKPLLTTDSDKLFDVWARLAKTFKNDPGLYGYELMNEPHDMPGGSAAWAQIAQKTTDNVRKVDKKTLIIIPGYNWQNAQNWTKNNPNLHITDPGNNLVYAAHVYFDESYDGKYSKSFEEDNRGTNIGITDSSDFRDWLKTNNVKGVFTEFGVPAQDQGYLKAMDLFLGTINTDPNITGAVYWSGGPWWKNYSLSIEPKNGSDRPQMKVLQKYMNP